MKHTRRFPFFTIPASKFLFADLKKIHDFVVLVRVTPKITRSSYVDGVLYLIFFCCALFCMLCFWTIYALSNVPHLLFTFLRQDWWMLLAIIYTGYTVPARLQLYPVIFWLTVAFLAGSVWIMAQARRALREFRTLRKMHTMTDAELAQISLQRLLRVSLPMWMSPSVSYKPTPEELLIVLREREQATESQTQAIASTLTNEPHEEEQDEAPSISWLLTLTDRATLSLLEAGGKRVTMVLTDAVAPLVGFLGTREKGVFTLKEDLFQQVYDPGKESAFAMHRIRTNKQITERAREAGFLFLEMPEQNPHVASGSDSTHLPTTNEDDDEMLVGNEQTPLEADKKKDVDFFEHQIQGQVSSWQLTSACNIEMFPFLTDFFLKVAEAQALPASESPLSLEQLRQGCHRVMEEYKEGFLSAHMKKGHVWHWALPFYEDYREKCLSLLSYANERERTYLNTCKESQEQFKVTEHIAQLYGWQALVATGLDLKDKGVYSEHDIERCLYYYGSIQKRSAARAIYQSYCKLRSQIDPTYLPGKELKQRAEDVISPSKKASRPRDNA